MRLIRSFNLLLHTLLCQNLLKYLGAIESQISYGLQFYNFLGEPVDLSSLTVSSNRKSMVAASLLCESNVEAVIKCLVAAVFCSTNNRCLNEITVESHNAPKATLASILEIDQRTVLTYEVAASEVDGLR